MPTTMALSPARARSIITTWKSAAMAAGVNNSMIGSGNHRKAVEPVEHVLRIAHQAGDDPGEGEDAGYCPDHRAVCSCEERTDRGDGCDHERQDAEHRRDELRGDQQEQQEGWPHCDCDHANRAVELRRDSDREPALSPLFHFPEYHSDAPSAARITGRGTHLASRALSPLRIGAPFALGIRRDRVVLLRGYSAQPDRLPH